jgi:DNA-directed RNA polymerase subunit RPC12/RpoP
MQYWVDIGEHKGFACDKCGTIYVTNKECDYVICPNCKFKFLTRIEGK